jgi:heterodisulfide reductase subunit C
MTTTNHLTAAKIKAATGVDVDMCYQCGKCSAGCVLAGDMDYPSSVVMRMLQTDDAENYHKILSSNAIWLCQNCENCIHCPKEKPLAPEYKEYQKIFLKEYGQELDPEV